MATPPDWTPDRPTTYFSGLAGLYAAHRPAYPPAAFEAMVMGLPRPVRAVDVGCGTGISARGLADAGAAVTGIDPNPDMLAAARAARPDVRFLEGQAEATGLPDGAADLVCCAQAFHWFDRDRALAEFARVLRPGGRLVLMWNVRETEHGAGRAYDALVEAAQAYAAGLGCTVPPARDDAAPLTPWFDDRQEIHIDNPQRLDRDGLIGRIRSASYFPRAGAERERLEAAALDAFETHAVDGIITLPQHAHVILARRRAEF